MSNVVLILLLFGSSATVVVRSQSCATKADCIDDQCCYLGRCSSIACTLLEEINKRKPCFYDFQCSNGCCVDSKCESTFSRKCYHGSGSYCNDDFDCNDGCCVDSRCKSSTESVCKRCTYNWDCVSNCCKENRCQETEARCYPPTTWSPPTFAFPTLAPYHFDDNDDYDYNDYSKRSKSSGLSTGAYVGLVIAGIAICFVKLFFWAVWCGRIRRRRTLVVVRRTHCVGRVGIVQHDEIQREHAQPPEGVPGRLPPYSPQADPPKYTPSLSPGGNQEIPPGANGAPQMGPPPEYTPSDTSIPGEIAAANPAPPNQIQGPEEGFTNPLYAVQVTSTENTPQNPNRSPETEANGTADGVSQGVTNGPPTNDSQ